MTYDEQNNLYDQQIQVIKMDQSGKLFRDDDHGVMDCSADIRELKAEKRGFAKGYALAKAEAETQPNG
jgi:hypothetical protein